MKSADININESIQLSEYDPSWYSLFLKERQRLQEALSLQLADIEHIGSTAVPGLVSKPVIDIMLGVKKLPPNKSVVKILEELGYVSVGEAGVPHRWYCVYRESVSFNLHIVIKNGTHWLNNCAVRDYLITHQFEREQYAMRKRKAMESRAVTLLSYSKAKEDFMKNLLKRARNWSG